MIALHDAGIGVGGRRLIDGANLRVAPGEFVALLGPNGSGKSTLLRTIAGVAPLLGGRIDVDGCDVARMPPIARARNVALVTSDEALLDALTVADIVGIGRWPHHRWWEWRTQPDDEAAVAQALEAVGATELAQRQFATLSSGERQRVWIALGLAQRTPVLLLDEPTSHLDVRVAHQILALLARLARAGTTVVCALHDLNDAAAYADRIALIAPGRQLVAAEPNALFSGDLLEETYRVAMERVRLPNGRIAVFAREAL